MKDTSRDPSAQEDTPQDPALTALGRLVGAGIDVQLALSILNDFGTAMREQGRSDRLAEQAAELAADKDHEREMNRVRKRRQRGRKKQGIADSAIPENRDVTVTSRGQERDSHGDVTGTVTQMSRDCHADVTRDVTRDVTVTGGDYRGGLAKGETTTEVGVCTNRPRTGQTGSVNVADLSADPFARPEAPPAPPEYQTPPFPAHLVEQHDVDDPAFWETDGETY